MSCDSTGHAAGLRIDWEEDVTLGRLEVQVEPGTGTIRLHVGRNDRGPHTSVYVEPDADGRVNAPAPTGSVAIQHRVVVDSWAHWSTVRQIDV